MPIGAPFSSKTVSCCVISVTSLLVVNVQCEINEERSRPGRKRKRFNALLAWARPILNYFAVDYAMHLQFFIMGANPCIALSLAARPIMGYYLHVV